MSELAAARPATRDHHVNPWLVLVVALVFAALAIWQITGDGEVAVYEGFALVATYALLATVVWFE